MTSTLMPTLKKQPESVHAWNLKYRAIKANFMVFDLITPHF